MGYYSYLEIDANVKDVAAFKAAREELLKQEMTPEGYTYLGDHLSIIDVNAKGELFIPDVEDPNRKWYNDQELVAFLLPHLTDGSEFLFDGEDGEGWGYRIRNGEPITLFKDWVELKPDSEVAE